MQEQFKDLKPFYTRLNIEQLNEMQQQSIEAAQLLPEMVLLSPTGSGKTLAFLLSLLQKMNDTPRVVQSVIITPSRELALQIESVFKQLFTGIKVTTCYGGHKREIEENNLIDAPGIIIGTPGRLSDHIRRGNFDATTVKNLVIDEFDKALETGFQDEMAFVVSSLPNLTFKMLTSATRAASYPDFLGFENVQTLDFLPENYIPQPEKITYQSLQCTDEDRSKFLLGIISKIGGRPSIIFCNQKETVEEVSAFLQQHGVPNVFYHGSMEQRDRERNLAKFRNGSVYFLITTDLASRGLDVPHIRYVIHYQLPPQKDAFVHRNGRTARMDASGTIILMIPFKKNMPSYVEEEVETITIPDEIEIPEKPKWTTLFIAAGKKNKINKIDIVGFLGNKGTLKKEEIGLIEVKDFWSFVAVRKSKASYLLNVIKGEKLKGKKILIEPAK